jgi:hypothetical protein
LADDASRKVLNAVLGYRLTLVPEVFAEVACWDDLSSPGGLLDFGRDEVYVDGGSCNGDTIRLFIERAGGSFAKVPGFEPDPRTFIVLAANFVDEPRVAPVNAGLWGRAGTPYASTVMPGEPRSWAGKETWRARWWLSTRSRRRACEFHRDEH